MQDHPRPTLKSAPNLFVLLDSHRGIKREDSEQGVMMELVFEGYQAREETRVPVRERCRQWYSGRIRLQDGSEGGCKCLRMKVSFMEVAAVTSRPVAAVVASDLMVVNSGRHKKLNGGTDDGLDGGS
ncbi:hypothetical protein L1987_32917 [Smallanthus sonchifolius]|uniref:Uncharacterized protein n=1 Tax=Smallanthus sonchifolius TaxID=185202 RepID=A0ACB9HQT5_9ASTR|nr:hypothetical protein L1987_32917 [Smallanthus sonchifolius]